MSEIKNLKELLETLISEGTLTRGEEFGFELPVIDPALDNEDRVNKKIPVLPLADGGE